MILKRKIKKPKNTKADIQKSIRDIDDIINELRDSFNAFIGSEKKKEKLYREGVEWILRKQELENKAVLL